MPGTASAVVVLPVSFNGRGFGQTCVEIIRHFADEGLDVVLVVARVRTPVPGGIELVEALPWLLRHVPWRFVRGNWWYLRRALRRVLRRLEPDRTVVCFWPTPPTQLVHEVKALGFLTVREMINSPTATAKVILDAAYGRAGLPPGHHITDERAAVEVEELAAYDYIAASNPEVESALHQVGVDPYRIVPASFGWSYRPGSTHEHLPPALTDPAFRLLFVGSVDVRKGVPDLLEAWRLAGVDGELLLVGAIEPALVALVDRAIADGGVRHAGYVRDPAALYLASDVFVLPTLEEGGPQVTYEAAAAGLPVITTPMGAARLVEHGENGLIVPPASPAMLAEAITALSGDDALRRSMGEAARRGADAFRYEEVGADRAQVLIRLLDGRWTPR